jgi:hypothetical protein
MKRLLLIGLGLALMTRAVSAQAAPVASAPAETAPESSEASANPASSEPLPSASPAPTPVVAEAVASPAAADPDVPSDAALADLAALGLDPNGAGGGVDLDFHLSGFADFTSVLPVNLRGALTIGTSTYPSFYVGNVNLYLSKNLSETFRTMGEVRFSYLPNGAQDSTAGALNYVSTEVADYAANSYQTHWGGIVIERLYLEWTLHPMVIVRAGQFLTPYGIWNVDHGSPAYIPVQRPYTINSNLKYFPQRQTGLEVLGRWNASNSSTLGYHLTLSNGGGPVSEYRDFDKNKALGARLYWEHQAAGFFRLGASWYYGMDTSATPSVAFDATRIDVGSNISNQFYALSFAADVTYKYRGLHFQAEGVTQQRKYTDAGRVAHTEYFAPVSKGFSADYTAYTGYALLAYSLPWYALTPYAMIQYVREVLNQNIYDVILNATIFQAGLTVHPTDAVTFKAEYYHTAFHHGGVIFRYPFNIVQLQAAWAF